MVNEQALVQDVVAEYIALTPKSRANHERLRQVVPGGTTRTGLVHDPYPLAVERGYGCRVIDLDGRELIDYVNAQTVLIVGHGHPAVIEAVTRQLHRGTIFASPTEVEAELAERVCQRVASVEALRFTNTGTEATMNALRTARAFTGREKIAKFEGGYHGTHDYASISASWHRERAGDPRRPNAVADVPGVPQAVLDTVVVLPYNDADAIAAILADHGKDLAAVLVEPVMGSGGVIPPEPGFLESLRQLCDQYGIVLIFDEIISLRVSMGGAQGYYGVKPDLTTMGKIIGGGFPIGAFGGRADIMELYDNRRKGGAIAHGGTFTGNPMSLAAGVATLDLLTPEVYDRLNRMGEDLRRRILETCRRAGVPAQVTGVGSLFNIHFTNRPVRNFRDARTVDRARLHRVFLSMLNRGVFLGKEGRGCMSTPMTEAESDLFIFALEKALEAEPE